MASRQSSLAAGVMLFDQGDEIMSLFLVLEGEVRLLRHQNDGQISVLQRAGPGAVLAEASVFAERTHCSARTTMPSRVGIVAMPILRQALARDPALALSYARHLSVEVRAARTRAEILSLRGVAARLDSWLAEGRVLPPKGKRIGLAEEIGVSPEALYREIAKRRTKSELRERAS